MAHRFIEKLSDIDDFALLLGGLKLPITVEWVQGRDRTKDQNALQWLWATEVAHQRGDVTPADVQAEWKLRHGIPILREQSPEFRDVYDRCLKPLSYEQKIEAMRDLDIPVTSALKVRQMVSYLDAVQQESVSHGFKLTDPDPELASYQNRYRMKDAA